MSDSIKNGGPAFPCDFNMSTFEHEIKGMSLRDWFAGQALAAYLAGRNRDSRDTATPNTAASCYAYADAMLAARNKEVAP